MGTGPILIIFAFILKLFVERARELRKKEEERLNKFENHNSILNEEFENHNSVINDEISGSNSLNSDQK